LCLGAFALLLTGAASCAQSQAGNNTPTLSGDMFGTDMNEPANRPDSVVRYADHPRGFAELRLPKGEGPFPLAVIFHGGCWKTGIANQAYMAPLASHWQALGIASLNVDYREVGDGGGWPGSFEDWAAAAALIEDVAGKYPINRGRVTLVGHSAGATPALWLASQQGRDGPVGAREAVRVHGIIVLDGAGDVGLEQRDFDALCEFSSVHPFMGGTQRDRAERYAAISPANHPPRADAILFVQAVLPAPGESTLGAMRAAGSRVEAVANEGASHFEILTPGSPVYARNEPAMLAILTGR
jgi:acetyl esterase/lipase